MKLRKKLVRELKIIEGYPVTYLYEIENPEIIYDVLVEMVTRSYSKQKIPFINLNIFLEIINTMELLPI